MVAGEIERSFGTLQVDINSDAVVTDEQGSFGHNEPRWITH